MPVLYIRRPMRSDALSNPVEPAIVDAVCSRCKQPLIVVADGSKAKYKCNTGCKAFFPIPSDARAITIGK